MTIMHKLANLVEGGVEVTFIDWGFLLLDPFLSKHQPDLDIRV